MSSRFVFRTVAFVITCVSLCLWSAQARAADTVYAVGVSGGSYKWFWTANTACAFAFANSSVGKSGGWNDTGPASTTTFPTNCVAKEIAGLKQTSNYSTVYRTICTTSKPNFNFETSACQAGAYTGPTPEQPNPCLDKNVMIRRYNYGAGPYTTPDHFGECAVTPVELLVCRKENGETYCMWSIKRTGEKYTGTDVPGTGAGGNETPDVPTLPPTPSPPMTPPKAPDIRPDAIPCPKGSVQAGINSDGVPICVGTGTNPPPAPTTPEKTTTAPQTTTNADGSSVTVVTTTQKNSDGSVTTTTRTTTRGVDGSETVKVEGSTTKTPSGAQGATDTPEKDQYDLCKQNPTLSICRNSSVSGSCGEITCQGDAIQCATLRAAAAMQCQQQKELEELKNAPSKQLGDAIQAGNDPMQGEIDAAMKGDEVDLSKPQLDDSGFLGGGGCIAPKTMHVAGHAVPVDFTQVCEDIQPLRAGIMACAFIIAYLIVARSVLGS